MTIENRKIQWINQKSNYNILLIKKDLAIDETFRIFINQDNYITLIATPSQKKELAVGHLFTEGIIDSINDIKSISFRDKDVLMELINTVNLEESSVNVIHFLLSNFETELRNKITIKLSKIKNDKKINISKVIEMGVDINHRSSIHKKTGGTHAAMLYDINGEFLNFAEDVGRHNAINKVIGAMMIEQKDLKNSILISTGRLSAEIIYKTVRAEIPIVITRTVPLISGIRLAEMFGQTLISIRRGQVKVYSNNQRITF